MQFSGYSQEDKVLVYKKAKRVSDNIVERDRVGQEYYTGVNSGKEETRGTLTNGIIGTKEEVMKQLCSWRQHPMGS